jgi:hypothetical protein
VGDEEDQLGVTPLRFPIVSCSEGNREIVLHRILEVEEDQSSDMDPEPATVTPSAPLKTCGQIDNVQVLNNDVVKSSLPAAASTTISA